MLFADGNGDGVGADDSSFSAGGGRKDASCRQFIEATHGSSYLQVPSLGFKAVEVNGQAMPLPHVGVELPGPGVVYICSADGSLGWLDDPSSYDPPPPRGFAQDKSLSLAIREPVEDDYDEVTFQVRRSINRRHVLLIVC